MSDNNKIGQLTSASKRAGLFNFADVAGLATKEEKRKQMLRRVQEVYEDAAKRERPTGKGDWYGDPDSQARVKCIELASRLMDLFAEDKSDQDREVDMNKIAEAFRSLGWKCEPPKAA